ncbi:MRN complex-interacting protein [Rhineura floridana]|uniref:MRN complex-interacting protein n=1 Tax=Rhineura floridana TaxID=261503 RepID=UPI002AC81BA2|nr:MRN complex-interacting protein [Rhineura floridana]
MAQTFQVLRCCFCNIFQVQQIKKSKKWNCKICDEKQSILKVFGEGSGSDCRHHVQKLNLLHGEVEQASMKMLRSVEEPIRSGDANTVVKLEENLGWQEEKAESVSRWSKYLSEKCVTQEKEDEGERMVYTEKQTYSSKNMLKHSKKCQKTSLHTSDAREGKKRRNSGFAEDARSFENRRTSTTVAQNCGDTTCKSVATPVEEDLVCRNNKDLKLRGAGLSKWEKFLLSKMSCNSGDITTTIQERQEVLVQTLAADKNAEREDTFNNISPSNWHQASKQNASIQLARVQQVSKTEYVPTAGIPVGRCKHSPSLANVHLQEILLNRLPEQPTAIPSVSPPGISNSTNMYRSLFSSEEDFDDI